METKELKKLLPYGSQNEIAEMAGVRKSAVSNFLNGKSGNYKIELAALKVAARIQKERKDALAELNTIQNG